MDAPFQSHLDNPARCETKDEIRCRRILDFRYCRNLRRGSVCTNLASLELASARLVWTPTR